jgi:catechol 2,3-dioxygenase-like lactoylglutathione lyase family enzyme
MKMTFNSSVVFVKDIAQSKKFYQTLLKQEIEHDFVMSVIFRNGLSLWQISPEHPVYQSNKTKAPNGKNKFELYFETDDINESDRLIKEYDVPLIHDVIEEAWGQRTIRFYDPDENIIEIGEALEIFIKRLYKSGLSEAQINEKTAVAVDVIKNLISKK